MDCEHLCVTFWQESATIQISQCISESVQVAQYTGIGRIRFICVCVVQARDLHRGPGCGMLKSVSHAHTHSHISTLQRTLPSVSQSFGFYGQRAQCQRMCKYIKWILQSAIASSKVPLQECAVSWENPNTILNPNTDRQREYGISKAIVFRVLKLWSLSLRIV